MPTDWIQTYTGKEFCPLDPNPDDICIEDIAHALSMICRYNGHCKRFYSVAEHSIYVSSILDSEYGDEHTKLTGDLKPLCLNGLLHDAGEAYLLDIPTPVKKQIPAYKDAESKLQRLILQKFGLSPRVIATSKPFIKDVDRRIVYNEAEELMPVHITPWHTEYGPPCDINILGLLPAAAESWFLRTFESLTQDTVSTPQVYSS